MRTTIEPLDLERDLATLHAWVTHPRSAFWQMQDATLGDVAAEYALVAASPDHHAWLGRVDGDPAFLVETYDPARSTEAGLVGLPELRPGDLGMHVLVAPPAGPAVPGFTRRVFAAVMAHCFAGKSVRRVVVEPDVRNEAIATLNAEAGFTVARTVTLPGKEAALSFCTRADFAASPLARALPPAGPATDAHLTPGHLAAAQRHLVTKAIAEFAHERMLAPAPEDPAPAGADPGPGVGAGAGAGAESGWYRLDTPGGSSYRFRARRLALEHWAVEPATLTRHVGGEPAELDAQAFVVELADELGIPDALLATYLEELAATLAAATWKLAHSRVPVADLVHADYQDLEAAMTEGHPGFVANNGRVGFGARDHAAYAPETGSAVRLVWLGVRRSLAHLSLGAGLTEEELYAGELDAATRDAFDARLRGLGLEPGDYLLMPVHPWQAEHKVSVTFAPDLARRDLVWLGEAPDELRPQQSIRTFFNTSRPERHYVKTALSIQNMGFMRGLSPAYMVPTPAINDWVYDLVEADPTLRACGFSVLRERAAIGYTGDAYQALLTARGVRSPYQKMLAALWRESPVPRLAEGERLATMASLLHRDHEGRALATAMIEESGLAPTAWLRRYLDAYLRPVVHCLLAHELAFMPHGENLVLVLRDAVPVRALMKDVGEEVAILGDRPLPPAIERIRASVPADTLGLAVHTDVLDGVLRHLAAILVLDGVLTQDEFWAEVASCVVRHAEEHPELEVAAKAYDLLRPEFAHSCLNRLQLRNTLEMVDLGDQAESLMYAGTLVNPLAGALVGTGRDTGPGTGPGTGLGGGGSGV